MKLFKQMICKICDIFKLPRFSQVPNVKIPKCKNFEIVPTNEFKKNMERYLKDIDFNDAKIYINGKEINKKGDQMINEENKNDNFQLYVVNNNNWKPLDKTEDFDLKYCNATEIENLYNLEEPIKLEFENAIVKEEIMSTLDLQNTYDFILDNTTMLRGTMKKEYLRREWYWRKKGKRYKRFFKHSKEVVMVFEGKVVK